MSGGFGLSFGFGSQPKKQEEQPFELTENMLLSSLPESKLQEFEEVFGKLTKMEEEYQKLKQDKADENVVTRRKESAELEEKTVQTIDSRLTLVAHMIDRGNAAVEEYERAFEELELCPIDQGSSKSRRDVSAYITRYVARAKRKAEQLSRSLNVCWDQLAMSNTQDSSEVLVMKHLTAQQKVVVLMAARVAEAKKRLEEVRDELALKLRLNAAQLQMGETRSSLAVEVQQKYNQFLTEKKDLQEKRSEESDLFGNMKPPAAQPATGGGFGSSFGGFSWGKSGSTSTGFGSTSSGFGNTSSGFGNTSSGSGSKSSGSGSTLTGFGSGSSGFGSGSSGFSFGSGSGTKK